MINRVIKYISVITCVATAVGFLARSWWFFELFSHFRVQYFVILAVCGIVYVIRQRHWEAVVAISLALINLAVVGNFQIHSPVQATIRSQQGPRLRAVMANVYQGNEHQEKLHQFIESSDPDLIVLIEVGRQWLPALMPLLEQYPYSRVRMGRRSGIALLSRIPFEDAVVEMVGVSNRPSLIARFKVKGQRFTLVGTHPRPPVTPSEAASRNSQIGALATFVSEQNEPVILLGDLNITPWSPIFTDLLHISRLRDSREGFGLQQTWPTWFPPAWIPIDHALVSNSVVVHDRRVGPHVGSDHYPVVLDFSISNKPRN